MYVSFPSENQRLWIQFDDFDLTDRPVNLSEDFDQNNVQYVNIVKPNEQEYKYNINGIGSAHEIVLENQAQLDQWKFVQNSYPEYYANYIKLQSQSESNDDVTVIHNSTYSRQENGEKSNENDSTSTFSTQTSNSPSSEFSETKPPLRQATKFTMPTVLLPNESRKENVKEISDTEYNRKFKVDSNIYTEGQGVKLLSTSSESPQGSRDYFPQDIRSSRMTQENVHNSGFEQLRQGSSEKPENFPKACTATYVEVRVTTLAN